MRHRVSGKKLGRDSDHRRALRMNLSRELLTHGRITTTLAKAKYVQGHAERIITIAKRGLVKAEEKGDPAIAVHARRLAASRLNNDRVMVQRLFDEVAPHFQDRDGGYTRILKLGPRKGDNAPMALIELVDYQKIGESDE
jgi:large subunit ribosomal protein L17